MSVETIGDSIARRYRIIEKLGSGGMGVVYKALDSRLQRLVALKTLRFAQNPEARSLFLREASALAHLNHPNIVQIYDAGYADALFYIAFEYVEGRTLDQIVAGTKRLDPNYAIEIICQVGTALSFAHQQGVIHRDLKPSNILISDDGRVLLLDFGLAIARRASPLTQTGLVSGTPAYMSPEQAMGELVDARSDIFSLGIVLYQLLTGARPFVDSSSSIGEVFRKLCEEAPTEPQEINPSVPSSLAEVVLKSLAKQPEQRFQTVDEFLSALIESNPRKTLSRPRLSLKRREKENEKSPVAFTNGFHFSDIFGELSGGAAGNAGEISPTTEQTSSARSSELKDASERTQEDVRQSYRVTDERIRDGAQQMNLEDVTLQSGARDSDPTASGLLPYRPTPSTQREELTQYPSAIAWLRVYDSAHAQREFRLAGKVTIGRSGFPLPSLEAAEIEREIVISDPLVSRQHACISLENDHFYITDMGSWHGTFVNGEQIQKHELGHGDEITVGGTLIVFTQSLLPGTLAEAKGVTPEVLAEANKLGVSPGILAEAKRIQESEAKRLQEFSTIWDQLTSSARHVR